MRKRPDEVALAQIRRIDLHLPRRHLDQPFDDKQRWIELRIANAATRVVLFTPEGHESRIGTFFNGSFTCDDVPATYRQLRARGVEFVSGPEKQPWGEFAVFKDPDGNQFVLSSP